MIRAAAALFAIALAAPATAQDVAASEGAILRWLDKVSGETADIEMSRGQTAVSGRLAIRLDECRYPVDNPAANAFAHLTITEQDLPDPVFAGWMVAASPALSALEHPRYDVWVLRCLTPEAPPVIDDAPEPDPDAAPEDTTPQEG